MNAPAVYFLHGFLGDPAEWRGVISRLGISAHSVPLPLPVAADWDAAIAATNSQIPDGSILVGYSMGARVALGCVHTAPSKYRAVCLLAANPGLASAEERAGRATQDADLAERLLREPLHDFLHAWYALPLFAGATPELRERWINQRQSLDRRYQANLLRCLSVARQPSFWPSLAELNLPCLSLVGQLDTKYQAIAQAMKGRNPSIRVEVIPGAGHAIHRERPEDVAQHLTRFIANVVNSFQHEGSPHAEF